MKKIIAFGLLIGLNFLYAQTQELTIEDAVLGYWKGLYPEQLRDLQWTAQGDEYGYQSENQLIIKNINGQEVKRITLSDLQKSNKNLQRMPWQTSFSKEALVYRSENNYVYYNIESGDSFFLNFDAEADNVDFSDKANAVAYTLQNNLYIATGKNPKIAVTNNSDKNIVSGQAIARSEYGITKGTFWSPEGNFLAFYQKDETNVTEYPLVDVTTYPATSTPIKYPMAGQGSEKAKVGIYDAKNQKTTYLQIDTSDEHYLTNLSWTPDEKYILLAEINRATTQYDLNLYDISTGKFVRTLTTETNDKWVEPENDAVFLPNSSTDFLWLSEKDGFMNIYRYSTLNKKSKQITSYDWVVKEILGFDATGKNVLLSGTGKDGRETHTFKVNLKTGKTQNLSPIAGTHHSQLSPDGNYLLDAYSSIDIPNVTQLISTKSGKKISLFSAANPLKNYKIGEMEMPVLQSKDGFDLYGRMFKPYNFDPQKKYPVLIYVYGGPHAQMVTNSYLGGASLWLAAFANSEDYIVFTLDNRGSAYRGFAFESGIHRQLGTLEIEDQMLGVDYLKSLPYVDADRIAVNGWSFGGFMTSSLMLRHPGVFTTGVAGGPVTDWKYYEVMYGERYMDRPQENPEGYENARLGKYIDRLKGKLLLITGSVDPTVVPQHSMTLLKEAVEKGVQIDFFAYPMHEHNVRGMDRIHLIKKMTNYILENNK